MRLPFHQLEPYFYSGLLDDPLLLVRTRPAGRSILFDCGQAHHLAKRVVKSLDAVFISHAHMDHFMGMDTLIRSLHVSPHTLEIFGPPGIAAKFAAKIASYDWNLTESSWGSFQVHEVSATAIETSLFPGPEGFPRRFEGSHPLLERTLYENQYLKVEAELCDHRIPALAFRVTEGRSFAIDSDKLCRNGFEAGDWLRILKKRFYEEKLDEELKVPRRSGDGIVECKIQGSSLYEQIRSDRLQASIGYLTDIGFTDDNVEKAISLLTGVTLLVCDCSFLAADKDKARVSHHLCTEDVVSLAASLKPSYLLPMHLSKTYSDKAQMLYDELELPPEVTLLRIPEHVVPAPLIPAELPTPWLS